MNPEGEPSLSRHLAILAGGNGRMDLERQVLAAAFKGSFEKGDTAGAALAHRGLCAILQAQLYENDALSAGSPEQQISQNRQPAGAWTATAGADGKTASQTEADAGIGRKSYVSAPAQTEVEAMPATVEAAPAVVEAEQTELEAAPAVVEAAPAQLEAMPAAEAEAAPASARQLPDLEAASAVDSPQSEDQPGACFPAPAALPNDIEAALELLEAELQSEEEDALAQVASHGGDNNNGNSLTADPIAETMLQELKSPEEIELEEFAFAGDPAESDSHYDKTNFSWPEEVMLAGSLSAADDQGESQPIASGTASGEFAAKPSGQALDGTPPAPAAPSDGSIDSIAGKSTSLAGRITQALERLTAAMPPTSSANLANSTNTIKAGEKAAEAANQYLSAPHYQRQESPPVLAQPVVEPPMFHAPPPQLELDTRAVPPLAVPTTNGAGDSSPSPDIEKTPHPAQQEQQAAPPPPPSSTINNTSHPAPQPQQSAPPPPVTAAASPSSESDAQPSAEAIAEMIAGCTPPNTVPIPMTPSQLIRTQTYYQILGVNKLSSYEEIHNKFRRLIRRLLRTRYSSSVRLEDVRELREVLRAVCVAHDVLIDPATRTDYDLRQLGMRTEPPQNRIETPADAPSATPARTRLMIGELLECANILDPTELQIALDMHKAEPGTKFGMFLVKAGFLNPEELDSALIGQRLISSGKLTVAQFQTAMFRMRDHATAFFDTLLVEGWLTPSEMLDEANRHHHEVNAPNTTPSSRTAQPAAPPLQAQALPLPEPNLTSSGTHAGAADHAAVMAAARSAESDLNAFLRGSEVAEDKND